MSNLITQKIDKILISIEYIEKKDKQKISKLVNQKLSFDLQVR